MANGRVMRRFLVFPITAALILLAGCAPGGPKDSPGTTPEPGAQPGSALDQPGDSSAGPGESEWDPRSWEPTVTITPVTMTEEEKQEFRAHMLASHAASKGLDLPDIPLERWVSGVDFAQSFGGCLKDGGFEGEWDGLFGFSFPQGIPAAQEAAFQRVYFECEARFTIDPIFMQEWTTDQLRLLFDYWDEFYIPCLEAHDVAVDTSQKPSREAWIAAFNTPNRLPWWPEEFTIGLGTARNAEVSAACDPYPPQDVFYGVQP